MVFYIPHILRNGICPASSIKKSLQLSLKPILARNESKPESKISAHQLDGKESMD